MLYRAISIFFRKQVYSFLTLAMQILVITFSLSLLSRNAFAMTCKNLFQTKFALNTQKIKNEDNVLAVHLTNFFPTQGVIRASTENDARFGPTLHFSLGQPVLDHMFGKWSKRKYGVVLPLSSMKNQILNLLPQDTFVLGNVQLPTSAKIFVPNNEAALFKTSHQIIFYDPQLGIKSSIEDYIKKSGTIQFQAEGPFEKSQVIVNKKNISDKKDLKEFFENIFAVNKEITSTTHDYTPWGNIDYAIIDFLGLWLKSGVPTEKNPHHVYINLLSIKDSLIEAQRIYKKMTLSSENKKNIDLHFINLQKNIRILEEEIWLQENFSRSFIKTDFQNNREMQLNILSLLNDQKLFRKYVLENMSVLTKIESSKINYSPRDLFYTLKYSSISDLQTELNKKFPNPSTEQLKEFALLKICKSALLVVENKLPASIGLKIWRDLNKNIDPVFFNYLAGNDIMNKLLKTNDIQINQNLIEYLTDSEIKKAIDVDMYYAKYNDADPELIKRLDSIFKK